MSILGRLKNIFVQRIVEDEFYQPITETEIYAILNKKGMKNTASNLLKLPHSASSLDQTDAIAIAQSLSQHTPQLEFRMLGYEPSVEAISMKVGELKVKLRAIDGYLLQHYAEYLGSISQSVSQFEEGRQFYATRKKVGEARFMLQKMSRLLNRSKTITRLNITIKNLRHTLKLLEKVPNIKKMGLVQLKGIDLQRLQRTNAEIATSYGGELQCLTNLSKYILKVNQESFNYIINNIKMCFDSFDEHLYEQVMRSYLIIQPPVALDQLLSSFLEERIRTLLLQGNDSLQVIANKLIALMINLHKIMKWHIINRALKTSRPVLQVQAEPQRRLSVSSNNSEEAPAAIQLGEVVYISLEGLKETFNRSLDSYLTDLITDNIISLDLEGKEIYGHLQVLTRLAQVSGNFTGKRLEKLRKAFIKHFNEKQNALFSKNSKEFVSSIEQQRSDWNRLAFPNNFKFVPIDRLLYRWTRMQQLEDHKKVGHLVGTFFSEQFEDPMKDEDDSSDEQTLQVKVTKLQSIQRLQKRFEQWNPKEYLSIYEGDVIVCQSSYKLLACLQRHTEFLIYAPALRHSAYLQHMLFLIEYTAYFIFNSLLSSKYRALFFEPTRSDTSLEKAYTLKRFRVLYPHLAAFISSFKSNLQLTETSKQAMGLYAAFRKDIKEVGGDQNQILRAKIVAIDSCKYCLAYFHQILKTSPALMTQSFDKLQSRVQEMRYVLQNLCVLLLTQSSQNILGLELQTIRSLFQSIRWFQAYQDLREYVHKIVGIVRESLQRLKACHRGEVPLPTLHYVFVFIWRTVLTYSVKLFLQGKNNNKRDNKLNFEKYVDDLYQAFDSHLFPSLPAAYAVFKSIFRVLLSAHWEQCRELLVEMLRKYDYIYPILICILENSEHMGMLADKEKEGRRGEMRQQIEWLLKEGK